MGYFSKVEHIEFDGANFFTAVLLPQKEGTFPTVIFRSPYVQATVEMADDEVRQNLFTSFTDWLDRGYAVVFQHCRGQGKSTGAFIPYIHEREDGFALRQWIRKQPFYNGELFLCGGSYGASLHYCTAPFEADIKGAVLEVQDTERYRLWYRNGQMRKGHANWHFGLYKSKCGLNKNFSMKSFSELPLHGLSGRVLGETAEDFEQMLLAPLPSNAFWNTRLGGAEARHATDEANIPILLTTGYNDFYIGGMFRMWNRMAEQTKRKCAMLVSPYNHGDTYREADGLAFPNGKRSEQFGRTYPIDWFDNIRKGTPLPYKKGEITYYRTFENGWHSPFYSAPIRRVTLPLGTDTATLYYDPLNPPSFGAEGTYLQDMSDRRDVISLSLPPLEKDVFVKGRIQAALTVRSNCFDTSFYMCISIQKPQGDYVLRHDITSLGYQIGAYTPNSEAVLDFCFDEYAFLLKQGERLRIDIAPTDNNTYVCHTNQKGAYSRQSKTTTAQNRVDLARSVIILPIEE